MKYSLGSSFFSLISWDKSKGAKKIRKRPQITTTKNPTGKKSMNCKAGKPFSIVRALMSRFVDVPMSVVVPPNRAKNDKGMRIFLYLMFFELLRRLMKVATMAVLFRKAEKNGMIKNIFAKTIVVFCEFLKM